MIEQASTLKIRRTVIARYKLRSKLSKTENLTTNLINKLKKSTLSENESEIYVINLKSSLTQINVTNLNKSNF